MPKRKLPVAVMEASQAENPDDSPEKSVCTPQIEECAGFPAEWLDIWTNIKEMRKHKTAPVDTMGCERLHETSKAPKIQRFQILLALMLSSQTKDAVTAAAMTRLQAFGCDLQSIHAASKSQLETLLYPVSFYKNKAKYIKATCEKLIERSDGDIPDSFDELVKLPGVGAKMAHLIMSTAWNQTTGIAVDTHVFRLAHRFKWLSTKAKTPELAGKELETAIDRRHWPAVNYMLVGFGQETCTPVKPHCTDCLNCAICPSSSVTASKTKK